MSARLLIGYGYHPATTGVYLQKALERRADVTFVGTPYDNRPGFSASGDLGRIIAGLPFRPDLYLHVDSGAAWYLPRGLTQLPCATACYLIDVHVQPRIQLQRAMLFDYAFTAQRDFVEVLRGAGHPQAYWLPLACDPEVHRRYDLPKRYDIAFAGATGYPYTRRTRLLEMLSRRYTMNDYSRRITPDEMARVYSQARLVFNCSLGREVNMRVFEGPATGTLLLTDRIGNGLAELVRDREHVVYYDDDTLLDVAEQFLRDDAARERIARQGYEHVRAHHTYDHRAATILETVLGGRGSRLEAPLRRRSDAEVELYYADVFSRSLRLDDTFEQFERVPPRWRYRLPVLYHIGRGVIRRFKRINR